MSLKHSLKALLPVLVLAVAVGCGPSKKEVQAKNRQKFDDTRALVQLSLAKKQFEAGNIEGARKSVDNAEGIGGHIGAIHVMSAKISIEEGALDRAEKSLKRAREIDPRNAEADYL